MKAIEKRLKRLEDRMPTRRFSFYDIDVPWKGSITEEQKNQLIIDSGILESEDYNEEDFNLFKFYISPDTG